MKLYVKSVVFLLLLVAIFGFGLPYLISMKSHEAVLAGVFLFIVAIPTIVVVGKNIFEDFYKVLNKEK